MGFIREPLGVDFVVDPRPLTEEDKKAIGDFIKADKLKRVKAEGKLLKRRFSARLNEKHGKAKIGL
jgi:hypothetical protein